MIYTKSNSGFTLIELLVSVALFTVVMMMSVGALLALIDANSRAQNMQQVMTNINFAMDSMIREIRTGRGYYCSDSDFSGNLSESSVQDCDNGAGYLSIVEGGESITSGGSNSRITFRYNGFDQTIERRVGVDSWYPITAPGVHITNMYFNVTDTETARDGDENQPSVSIFIEGYAGELESTESVFQIQATVVKRVLDI